MEHIDWLKEKSFAIAALTVKDGDTIVLSVDAILQPRNKEEIRAALSRYFPNNQTLILDRDLKIGVMEAKKEVHPEVSEGIALFASCPNHDCLESLRQKYVGVNGLGKRLIAELRSNAFRTLQDAFISASERLSNGTH